MLITDCPVVELRQYRLKPGAADALVAVFEAQFLESQEALGMAVGGLFPGRAPADRVAAFSGGQTGRGRGAAARATMVDRDDVLLLRPPTPAHQPLDPGPRRP